MPYTVIFPSGRRMHFYVHAMANMYATIYKGRLVRNEPVCN